MPAGVSAVRPTCAVRGHAPMKRGLKPPTGRVETTPLTPCPWTCPDEEGIETSVPSPPGASGLHVRGHAPMKRGLKQLLYVLAAAVRFSGPWTCPDEEGIETRRFRSVRRPRIWSVDMPR